MQAQRTFSHTHALTHTYNVIYIYLYIYIHIYIIGILADKLGKVYVYMFVGTDFIQDEWELNSLVSCFPFEKDKI